MPSFRALEHLWHRSSSASPWVDSGALRSQNNVLLPVPEPRWMVVDQRQSLELPLQSQNNTCLHSWLLDLASKSELILCWPEPDLFCSKFVPSLVQKPNSLALKLRFFHILSIILHLFVTSADSNHNFFTLPPPLHPSFIYPSIFSSFLGNFPYKLAIYVFPWPYFYFLHSPWINHLIVWQINVSLVKRTIQTFDEYIRQRY